MKVGTDGVLLGAWAGAELDPDEPGWRILDVGTGTGLVALMLAQRFRYATIRAVEIDENAWGQAVENISDSPWSERIQVIKSDFRNWEPPDGLPFRLIACNPPYFSRSLKNPDPLRSKARHDDDLPLPDLIMRSAMMLAENGRLALVLPAGRVQEALDNASDNGLFLRRRLSVRGHENAPVKRVLLEWSNSQGPCVESGLSLETERGIFSAEYRRLTDAFYL